jgi:hypothetical protein
MKVASYPGEPLVDPNL